MFKQKVKSAFKEFQRRNTLELIASITKYNYTKFQTIMARNSASIIWAYTAENGDTLLHIACRATRFLKASVKKQYCLPLINKLGKGFLNIRNQEGRLPHELIGGQDRIGAMLDDLCLLGPDSVDETLTGERNYRISQQTWLNQGAMYPPDLETPMPAKPFPGLYFTDDLNIVFNRIDSPYQCEIPDNWPALNAVDHMVKFTLHQRLAMSCLLFRKSNTESNQVTANIGFIIANTTSKATQFLTFPINVPGKRIISLQENLGGHSEIALFHYLQLDSVIDPIIASLQASLDEGTFRVYGLILDIFTERDMCGGCQHDGFLRMRQYDDLLQKRFVDKLRAKSFKIPKAKVTTPHIYVPEQIQLRFAIRVSSRQTTRASGLPEYNPTYSERSHNYAYPKFGNHIDTPADHLGGTDIVRPTSLERHTLADEYRNIELFQNSVVIHISPDKFDDYAKALAFMVKHNAAYEGKLAISRQTVFISRFSNTSPTTSYNWDKDLIDKSHVIYSEEGNSEIRWGF